MSDEAPDTMPGAIKAYIGALGFIVVLIGAEMIAEKENARFWLGVALVAAGLPIMSLVVFWNHLRSQFGAGFRRFIVFIIMNPIWLTRALWISWLFFGYEILGTTWAQFLIWIVVLGALLWVNSDLKYFGVMPRRRRSREIADSVYIAEIVLDMSRLGQDRYMEIVMRVFNGCGAAITFDSLEGHISYRALRDAESAKALPPPSLRSDVKPVVYETEEWLIILSQSVPAENADEIQRWLDEGKTIGFDLDALKIQVKRKRWSRRPEAIKMWAGVSCALGLRTGRIISAKVEVGGTTLALN